MPGFDPAQFPGVTIHESVYIDPPCEIGEGTKIWHFSHIMKNCRIGPNCNLGQNVVVSPGVVMGRNVKVQNNVSIYEGVILEDNVFCGPSMVFTNVLTPRSEIVRRGQYVETPVGKGATFGANCTIVCGHTIGAYALVGAGAVCTTDVPPYALMVGVPARRVGWACRCGIVLQEGRSQRWSCPDCGNEYKADGAQLQPVKETQGR
jgi:UDP-2-acetamido-3-amino-2,3-dideoxy-glucuronate N-acetyltransferase